MGVMRHTDRSLRSSSAATGFVYRAIYCFALLCFALLCFALLCFALAFDLLLIYLPLREAVRRGKPFWVLFRRLEKVPRRKGETRRTPWRIERICTRGE